MMWFFVLCLKQDSKVHIYTLAGTSLHDKTTLAHNGAVTSLKYSPDGTKLAAGDTYRKVLLYQLPDYSVCTFAIFTDSFS
jgi:WD40 repeat protein